MSGDRRVSGTKPDGATSVQSDTEDAASKEAGVPGPAFFFADGAAWYGPEQVMKDGLAACALVTF